MARPDRHPALVPVAVTAPEDLGLTTPAVVMTAGSGPASVAGRAAGGAGGPVAAALTLAGGPPRPTPVGLGPSVGAGLVDLGAGGARSERPPPAAALGVVGFAPGSAAVPEGARAALRRAAALTGAGRAPLLRVVGYGVDPALAAERAAAVGFALVGLGVAAGDLRLAVESSRGAADDARVFPAVAGVR